MRKQIIPIFEKRKCDLIHLLETGRHMDAEEQHQIYGAIKEIERILEMLA